MTSRPYDFVKTDFKSKCVAREGDCSKIFKNLVASFDDDRRTELCEDVS